MSKAALITGSAKRVGREMALHLARHGYDIALHYNHSKAEALELQESIEAIGQQAALFQLDLADTQQIEPWCSTVAEHFPKLELLINNASIFERISFTDSDLATYQNHMAINATAPIFLTKAFAQQVDKGHVINLLDTNITSSHGSHFFYLLSKKTLTDFTKMAARDLAPNIRINGICPGPVLPSDQQLPGYTAQLEETLPMAELGNVEDIIHAVDYLIASPHVTGQLLFTDSGQHLL